jgi:death-on-curing protein
VDSPRFLTVDRVLQIHQDQIARYGGGLGVRDMGLLESAVAAPAMTFGGQFLHEGLFEMAATYLFGLVMNHPFIDGNKRVGTTAALAFLLLNRVKVAEDEPAFADLVLAVATGQADRAAVVKFFEAHAQP